MDLSSSYDAVVLYYRRGPDIDKTLSCLQSQGTQAESTTVVDNCSRDGILEEIAPSFPGMKFHSVDRNRGYAGGMNYGARQANQPAKYLLLVTHEVTFAPTCVADLLRYADATGASIVGPTLTLGGAAAMWSYGGDFKSTGMTVHRVHPSECDTHGGWPVEWIDGSMMLVRRSVFDELAGFDERYFLYWEDVDLCVRAQALGPVLVHGAAHATQMTGMTPVYCESRNSLLFWLARRKPAMVIRVCIVQLIRALKSSLRGRHGILLARARIVGMFHAATRKFSFEWSMVR